MMVIVIAARKTALGAFIPVNRARQTNVDTNAG